MKKVIAVGSMGHSKVNVEIRDLDTPLVDGKPNPAIQKQLNALTSGILRGQDVFTIHPRVNGENNPALNWRPDSVFIVEPRPEQDNALHALPFSVLSGRHRLDWFASVIETIKEKAKATKDETEATRLNALADEWNAFEIACDVRTPANDEERRAIVAKGNEDQAANDTRIVQSYPSRFLAWYDLAPRPEYQFSFDATGKIGRDKKVALHPVANTEEGWKKEYSTFTGIGGNFWTTYAALTRLGRHFNIAKEFFAKGNRLTIKAQVTQALLIKETDASGGSDVTRGLDYGIENRYKHARAACTNKKELDACFNLFKEEFLAILDGEGDGMHALGNTPPLSADEQKEADAEKKEAQKESIIQGEVKRAEAMTYRFEQEACARFAKAPQAPTIDATKGNLFDVLLNLNIEQYPSVVSTCAAFKAQPSDETADAVLSAFVDALATTYGTATKPHAIAAKTGNTKKAKK